MATYNSAGSGNFNVDATWTETGHPSTGDTAVIASGHTVTMTADDAVGSIDIQGTLTTDGTPRTLTLDANAQGYICEHRGTVSTTINLVINSDFAGDKLIRLNNGANGNFNDVSITLQSSSRKLTIGTEAASIDGDLTLTLGEFNTDSSNNYALTVDGDVIITGGGLVCNSSTVSVDSFTISSGGILSAPDAAGSLTLNGTKNAWSFQNNSTGFSHNNGTITQTNAGHIKSVSSNPMYNFTLNSSSSDSHEAVFRPSSGTDCILTENNLTITRGVVKLNTASNNASVGGLDIGSTGTFQASTADTSITKGNFNNSGTFTHNDGMVKFTHATNTQHMQSGGTVVPVFYKLDNAQPSVGGGTIVVHKSITVVHTLSQTGGRFIQFKGDVGSLTVTLGSSEIACTVTDANRCLATLAGVGPVHFYGAEQTKPFVTTTGQPNHACDEVHYKWGDLSSDDFTTHNNITIDGDMKFGAMTVASGDELDINGQRVEFTGNVTYSGSLKANGLLVFHGGFTKYGTLTNAANADIMTMSTSGTPTFSFITDYRTFFQNGGVQLGTGGFTGVTNAIVAGTTNVGTRNTSATNLTIATGAAFQAENTTHTVSGDFSTAGGLIGLSGLDFDGSTATTSPFTFLDVPYDLSNLQNSDATIEMWLNPESKSGDAKQAGVINGYVAGQTNRWQLDHLTNDTFNFNSHENNRSINFSVNVGKMNHIALVFDDSENLLQIYHDGKLIGKNTLGTGIDLGTVGADPDLGISWQTTAKDTIRSNYMGFRGQFYMYRIFNTARTEAQIRADMFNTHGNMVNTTGLQVMYQFDEGSGGAGDTVDNKEGTASRDGVLSNPGAAPNWVGAGNFVPSGSTLVMAKTGAQKIFTTSGEIVRNITINAGSTTDIECVGSDSGSPFMPVGNVTVNGTLTSTSVPLFMTSTFVSNGGTFTFGGSADLTGFAGGIRCAHTSGDIEIPAVTTKFIRAEGNGGTVKATGDLTLTTELQVDTNSAFNANDKTITAKLVDVNGGNFDLGAGTLVLTHPGSGFDSVSDTVFTAGPGATITGSSAATTFKSQNNFVVVGKVENLDVTNEELSVTGQVINCTGDIIQQFPTIDHDQQLDFDTADDRDIILGRDLDKNTELINS